MTETGNEGRPDDLSQLWAAVEKAVTALAREHGLPDDPPTVKAAMHVAFIEIAKENLRRPAVETPWPARCAYVMAKATQWALDELRRKNNEI